MFSYTLPNSINLGNQGYLTLTSCTLDDKFKLVLYLYYNFCYQLWVLYKFCNPVKLNSRYLPSLTVCKQVMLSLSDIELYRQNKSIEIYIFTFSCFYVKVILPFLHVPCITGLKYKSIFSCFFYAKVVLPCLHVPCITGLNLSCICTSISVNNSGSLVSSVILSS